MHSRDALAVGLVLFVVAAEPIAGTQKREQPAVVEIEYSKPPAMKPGDETTTELSITVKVDLDRLALSIVKVSGVDIVEEPLVSEFQHLKQGQVIRSRFRVRLTDRSGNVAATCTASVGNWRGVKYEDILYGDEGE